MQIDNQPTFSKKKKKYTGFSVNPQDAESKDENISLLQMNGDLSNSIGDQSSNSLKSICSVTTIQHFYYFIFPLFLTIFHLRTF